MLPIFAQKKSLLDTRFESRTRSASLHSQWWSSFWKKADFFPFSVDRIVSLNEISSERTNESTKCAYFPISLRRGNHSNFSRSASIKNRRQMFYFDIQRTMNWFQSFCFYCTRKLTIYYYYCWRLLGICFQTLRYSNTQLVLHTEIACKNVHLFHRLVCISFINPFSQRNYVKSTLKFDLWVRYEYFPSAGYHYVCFQCSAL